MSSHKANILTTKKLLNVNFYRITRSGASLCEERIGAERQQKSEERNTNREGVASGSATQKSNS